MTNCVRCNRELPAAEYRTCQRYCVSCLVLHAGGHSHDCCSLCSEALHREEFEYQARLLAENTETAA